MRTARTIPLRVVSDKRCRAGPAIALLGFALFVNERAARTVEAAVDLTGRWNLTIEGLLPGYPQLCAVDIGQAGTDLSIVGSCDLFGGITGVVNVTGSIETATGAFSAGGTGAGCTTPVGAPAVQSLTGTASADGTFIGGSFACDGGGTPYAFSATFAGSRLALCGNGTLDPGEECEDANIADGDGCSAGCREERPDPETCYRTRTTSVTSRFGTVNVLLTDQFETKSTKVLRPGSFCNPTSVFFQRVVDPTAHLTCYKITDGPDQSRFTPRDVVSRTIGFYEQRIIIDFSPSLLTIKKPTLLCVPSEKDGVASELNINHFKCYTARSRSRLGGLLALAIDEFGGLVRGRRRIDTFCTPVDADGRGIKDPTAHLLCSRLVGGEPAVRELVAQNEFGEQMLTVVTTERICAPAVLCDPLPAVCQGRCGDGTVDGACCENCDPPFSRGGAAGCSDTCQDYCGNSVTEPAVGEECDNYPESNPDPCQGRSCQHCTCAPPG